MNRLEKEAVVASLHDVFQEAESLVVTHYSGLTVAEMTALRQQVREVGAQFKVTQNRLTRFALKDTKFEQVSDLFEGPTAVAWSFDAISAAKAVYEFSKKNDKLIILGGGLENERLDASSVVALANMPSLDELRGKLVGLISAPARDIASVVAAPSAQLARVFGAYGSKADAA